MDEHQFTEREADMLTNAGMPTDRLDEFYPHASDFKANHRISMEAALQEIIKALGNADKYISND